MVLLLLVALSYVGIVLVILLAVLFCGVHCYSYGLSYKMQVNPRLSCMAVGGLVSSFVI